MLNENITEHGFSLLKTPDSHLQLVSNATGKKKLPPRTLLLMLREMLLMDAGNPDAKDAAKDFTFGFKSSKAGFEGLIKV